MKERNLQLDILKIMACFAVVIIHVTGIITFNVWYKYSIAHTLYYLSGFAVPIFFMVNGYFLLNKKSINYRYVIKKVLNILLVVFSWSLVYFIIHLVLTKKTSNPLAISLNSLIQREYFWQFWFFGSLIIIYLVLPLLHKFFVNDKAAIVITLVFIICSLIIDLISVFRSMNREPIIQVNVIQTFRLWTWFAYYLLGGLLGKKKIMTCILNKISMKINILIFLITSIIISIYQYNMARKFYGLVSIEFFYDNIFTFVWVISLFIIIYRQKLEIKSGKFISLISDKIMGVYIVHVTVINVVAPLYNFGKVGPNILLIIIVAAISLISTLIINKIPLINRLTKI